MDGRRVNWILDRARDRRQGRLMEHVVHAFAGTPAGVEGADVSLDPLERARRAHVADRVEIRLPARREIVQDAHVVAVPEQALGEVRADEARPAGDEVTTHDPARGGRRRACGGPGGRYGSRRWFERASR